MLPPDEQDRRRSRTVALTLIGVAGAMMATQAIPEGQEVRRNLYGDRQSCERDYAPAQCEHGGGGSSGGGHWRGPEYYSDRSAPEALRDPGPGRAGAASTHETSLRGGFGRVGRFLRAAG